MNKDKGWSVGSFRFEDIQLFNLGRAVRDTVRLSKATAGLLTVGGKSLDYLLEIRCGTCLVVRVIQFFLVHIQPNTGPFFAECLRWHGLLGKRGRTCRQPTHTQRR